jgi:hypothetical protein
VAILSTITVLIIVVLVTMDLTELYLLAQTMNAALSTKSPSLPAPQTKTTPYVVLTLPAKIKFGTRLMVLAVYHPMLLMTPPGPLIAAMDTITQPISMVRAAMDLTLLTTLQTMVIFIVVLMATLVSLATHCLLQLLALATYTTAKSLLKALMILLMLAATAVPTPK